MDIKKAIKYVSFLVIHDEKIPEDYGYYLEYNIDSLRKLYSSIQQMYNYDEFKVDQFIKDTERSVLNNKSPRYVGYERDNTLENFYSVYFYTVQSIINKRLSEITNNMSYLQKDIINTIIKYDYFIEGKTQIILAGHKSWAEDIEILSNNRIATASMDNTIRIWNTNTGECQFILIGHTEQITGVTFFPIENGEKLISGSYDGTIRIWNLHTGICEKVLQNNTGIPNKLVIVSGERFVSSGDDGTLKIWNLEDSLPELVIQAHPYPIRCLIVINKEHIVSGIDTVKIWDSNTGNIIRILKDFDLGINSMIYFKKKIIFASDDNIMMTWNIKTGKIDRLFEGHTNLVTTIKIYTSPRGENKIISGSFDKDIRVWDFITGQCEQILHGHQDDISSLVILPDGRLLSGGQNTDIGARVWDLETGNCDLILPSQKMLLISKLLPDGRIIRGGAGKNLYIWK